MLLSARLKATPAIQGNLVTKIIRRVVYLTRTQARSGAY